MQNTMTFKTIARRCLVTMNRFMSVLDRPFRKESDPVSNSLFIVGLPRSGTTLAYELIVQAFEVAYFSKVYNYTFGLPNLTTRLTTRFGRRPPPKYESNYGNIPGMFAPAENHHFWSTWFRENSQRGHYVPASSIPERQVLTMNRALASISAIAGQPFVFKDIYLTLSVDAVLQCIRGSRLLVISRDPEAVAASVYRKRSQLSDTGDWWSIKPPLVDAVATASLAEQVAFQCVRSQQVLESQLSQADPERYRIVDYAEICNAPRTFVENLRQWLGSSFRPRDGFIIPEHFENRPSVGFPGDIRNAYAELASRFETGREAYLAQVNGLAGADDSAARPGPGSGNND